MVHHRKLLFIFSILLVTTSPHPFQPANAISAINNFYKNNRFKGAFLTCAVKGCSADLVAQYIAFKKEGAEKEKSKELKADDVNNKKNILGRGWGNEAVDVRTVNEEKDFCFDARRSAVFLLYGGLYQGMAQEAIYNDFMPKYFGTSTDFKTVVSKVIADMGFITPLICIPMAYFVKGLLVGDSFSVSLQNYWGDVVHRGVLFKNWMIFVPVQCLTFSVIPPHFRVSFVAFVSFFWVILLSCILSG
mmetsp:Transcript_10977/g.23325  ORF Transcript_10977/g.23325 Transcript_10977/m.23325 type:complete len:246 (+) Transcript_10977:457-1194(+)